MNQKAGWITDTFGGLIAAEEITGYGGGISQIDKTGI